MTSLTYSWCGGNICGTDPIDPRNILVAARQCTVQHYSWPTQLEQLYGSGRGGREDTPHAYRRLNLVLAPS